MSGSWQVGQHHPEKLPADGGEGVAVEEEKRCPAMKRFQEVERFSEGEDGAMAFVPLALARSRSF